MMRSKNELSVRRRMFEYYSTLTHELIHCLGLGHFPNLPEFNQEVMFPGILPLIKINCLILQLIY